MSIDPPQAAEDVTPPPVWDRFREAVRLIPPDELQTLPPDGASEHDHYIYGVPKQSL
ncbi:MAG TPA: hypothetical protein VGX03_06315 [Candidatus Binatia bacterium]|jgi:hypothetical protein|nr:hypothetical protein [Candidatus Binatia bacterium]